MKLTKKILAFDIGGTWFRSAMINEDMSVTKFVKQPAINYIDNQTKTAAELQELLILYIVETFHKKKQTEPSLDTIVISMGAATRGNTGFVFNSGPLWGPNCRPFDLKKAINNKIPNLLCHIENDVTASLLWHINNLNCSDKKLCLITISTGIACRIYCPLQQGVPLDPTSGLQGEIGHIPTTLNINGQNIEAACDCGGKDHLNAFCSGRGINNILPIVANLHKRIYQESFLHTTLKTPAESLDVPLLVESYLKNEEFATITLRYATLPIAKSIISMLTIDPTIDKIVLTGGITHSFAEGYRAALLGNLNHIGLYQKEHYCDNYFESKIIIGPENNDIGLLGAVYSLQTHMNNNENKAKTNTGNCRMVFA